MMYCPNCGEDGWWTFECIECGAIKCNDCATDEEYVTGVCIECIPDKEEGRNV